MIHSQVTVAVPVKLVELCNHITFPSAVCDISHFLILYTTKFSGIRLLQL
jgi:hypothetical protein